MTRTRLGLMIAPALPLAPVLLALAACGGGSEHSSGNAAPLGFELAMAAAGADASVLPAKDVAASAVVPISAQELWTRIEAGNVRVIDVRTDDEVNGGIIPEAEHIALEQFDPAALDLSDGRKVVLYCRSGRRSAIAAEQLAAAIGAPVEHLDGGMLAWEETGLPVDKPQHLED